MLTPREKEILTMYTIYGLSAKEIADRINRSVETVKKTISNVKLKVGLQKSTELTVYFIGEKFGIKYEDFKKQLISIAILFLVVFCEFSNNKDFTGRINTTRAPGRICRVRSSRKTGKDYDFLNVA